ncbi:preprotein translocase subunit YajC [Hallella absiana]|uniref:preprotein translocase subunit YajC n=1 Tax=Hallella absiana TaxID=2925336 RepID=UPI0021CA32C7|nr:preprotein translocase subunit YajC [Hallella absiana]
MNTMVLAAQAAQQGGGFGGMLIMLVALFAIMWFFMIRPQQKKQKKIREFQNSLQEGSKVVTGGGVYGTVKRLDNEKNVVEVEVARGVVISVDKNYVFQDAAQQQPNA